MAEGYVTSDPDDSRVVILYDDGRGIAADPTTAPSKEEDWASSSTPAVEDPGRASVAAAPGKAEKLASSG